MRKRAFLVQHNNRIIREESTAGGAFTLVGAYVLERGGVVFGAAYDEQFNVHHTYVENVQELGIFRNSKYVQSDLGETFKLVKRFLKEGRLVCFSGTPCQVAGLYYFLGGKTDNLLLVDVVCHGIPSPLIWNKYLELQDVHDRKVENIRFRDKYYGYKYSTMSFIADGRNIYHAGSQSDPMLRAFFSDICDRPACYECKFKTLDRVSDITIWDCFSVHNFDKRMDDDKGTTRVLCHTEKGVSALNSMASDMRCIEVNPEKLIFGVKEMFESVQMNPNRKTFFEDARVLDGKSLFNKYFPMSVSVRLKTLVRLILFRTGLYKLAKAILNSLRGR